MRKLSLLALFCISFAAASGAAAQNVVYTVEGWPKFGPRADGKGEIGSLNLGTAEAPPAPGAKFRELSFTTRIDDRVVLFMRHSLEGTPLPVVLIEAFAPGAKPAPRAPFAVRLLDVRVSAVTMAYGGGPEPGQAQVSLRASKVEFFTARQSSTGTMEPGLQFRWDVKAGKGI